MPVLAAIQGACIGGGFEWFLHAIFVIPRQMPFFAFRKSIWALSADVGTLQRLPNLIPDGLMRELAYTGRRLFAEEAKEIGLVNNVYATHEEMLTSVMSIANEIASKSPLAVTSTKHLLNYGREHGIQETLAYQSLWMGAVSQGSEMQTYFRAKSKGDEPSYADLPPSTNRHSEDIAMTEQPGLFDTIYNCRAMRRLKTDPVPEEEILQLIEAANQALPVPTSRARDGSWYGIRISEKRLPI
ncbi:MAG: hypothetical protein CM1200mP9_09660 [Gammaproteobacteria bacterium]|nr:MAG: hypothetical protein CM1200mP9_09660 [Gammaproteobacteria bacterium]